jgi:hypothetical protein
VGDAGHGGEYVAGLALEVGVGDRSADQIESVVSGSGEGVDATP